jgi:hypothetical protein
MIVPSFRSRAAADGLLARVVCVAGALTAVAAAAALAVGPSAAGANPRTSAPGAGAGAGAGAGSGAGPSAPGPGSGAGAGPSARAPGAGTGQHNGTPGRHRPRRRRPTRLWYLMGVRYRAHAVRDDLTQEIPPSVPASTDQQDQWTIDWTAVSNSAVLLRLRPHGGLAVFHDLLRGQVTAADELHTTTDTGTFADPSTPLTWSRTTEVDGHLHQHLSTYDMQGAVLFDTTDHSVQLIFAPPAINELTTTRQVSCSGPALVCNANPRPADQIAAYQDPMRAMFAPTGELGFFYLPPPLQWRLTYTGPRAAKLFRRQEITLTFKGTFVLAPEITNPWANCHCGITRNRIVSGAGSATLTVELHRCAGTAPCR